LRSGYTRGCTPGALGVYDVSTHRLLRTIRVGARGLGLQPLGFSSSGDALALAVRSSNRFAVVSDLLSANPKITYGPTLSTGAAPAGLATSGPTALSAAGTVAATRLESGSVAVTNTRSGAQTTVFLPSSEDLQSIAVSGSRLAVSGTSNDTRIFNLDGSEWLQLAPPVSSPSGGSTTTAEAVGFSPSGSRLVTASSSFASRFSLLSLDAATWAASLCAGSPTLITDQYAQYAGGGTEKPLCP
jgi:hypothetical protein